MIKDKVSYYRGPIDRGTNIGDIHDSLSYQLCNNLICTVFRFIARDRIDSVAALPNDMYERLTKLDVFTTDICEMVRRHYVNKGNKSG